jgi:hypothetical protein
MAGNGTSKELLAIASERPLRKAESGRKKRRLVAPTPDRSGKHRPTAAVDRVLP